MLGSYLHCVPCDFITFASVKGLVDDFVGAFAEERIETDEATGLRRHLDHLLGVMRLGLVNDLVVVQRHRVVASFSWWTRPGGVGPAQAWLVSSDRRQRTRRARAVEALVVAL